MVQVAAGANHTVLRTSLGAVFTFGAHKMGQLMRFLNIASPIDPPNFYD